MNHIVAAWRQKTPFRTIYQLGALKNHIAIMINREGNTMLHIVASTAKGEWLNFVAGCGRTLA